LALQTPAQSDQWTFRRIIGATLVLVLIAFCFWLLYRFNQVVFILLISIVMGTVIRPLVSWLYSHGVPRIAGVILVYVVLLALLVSFVLMLFPLIVEQWATIAAAVPDYYQSLHSWLLNNPNQIIAGLGEFLPAALPGSQPVQQSGEEILASAGQALGYVGLVAQVIFIAIAVLLLAFHWTLDGPRIVRSLLLMVPLIQREKISELVTAMESKVGSYIAGQAVLCLIIGSLALIVYLIIGLPNALVLAFVAGVMEAVPMIGPLLGAIPAGVIAFSISPAKLAWVIIATVVIQQLENAVLVPRVMRKAVGVNPFVSLLAIFAFSSLFGIAGALMAIPMAAIIQLLVDRYIFHPDAMESDVSPGRDYASRLRYEAQDLVQDLRKQARIHKGGSDLKIKQIDQFMDEIETITIDLDAMLANINPPGAP